MGYLGINNTLSKVAQSVNLKDRRGLILKHLLNDWSQSLHHCSQDPLRTFKSQLINGNVEEAGFDAAVAQVWLVSSNGFLDLAKVGDQLGVGHPDGQEVGAPLLLRLDIEAYVEDMRERKISMNPRRLTSAGLPSMQSVQRGAMTTAKIVNSVRVE